MGYAVSNIIKQIDRLDFNEEQKKIIRDTYANGATEAELAPLLEIAAQRRLNPFMRQVWFVKRWDNAKKCYVWSIQVAIDGLRAIAERTGKYAGQSEAQYCYQDSDDPDSVLKWCKVRVYREGWREPVTGWAFYNEFVQKTNEGKITAFWQRMPHIMLAKCAEALALRKAFPEDMAGLYIPEEMGAGIIQQGELLTEEPEQKQLAAPPQRIQTTPASTPVETVDTKTGEVTTPQPTAQAPLETTPDKQPTATEVLAKQMVELRAQLDKTPKPRLYAMVQLWKTLNPSGEFGLFAFNEIMQRLPARMPKAWFYHAQEINELYSTQEPMPENPGDSYEPSERARFTAFADVIEQAVDAEKIAAAWIARKSGFSNQHNGKYWWYCAIVECAIGENIDCAQAKLKLEAEVAKLLPQPPEPEPDTNAPKKRTRKAPAASTPANGQGHETTQQVGTTGRTEHVPVASVAGWEARLITKQTPYACAASWAKWRHLYQHCAAECRGLTLARMEALGATEEVVLNGKIHLVPLPAQLDGIVAKYEQDKLDRERFTVRRAA